MTAAPEVLCPKRRLRRLVADVFGIEEHLLVGGSRRAPIVRARYAFAYVARVWWPDISYPRLGALLGGRDHSSVINGLRQLERWRAEDPVLQQNLARLLAARLSDQHNAHVRAWSEHLAEREREIERKRRIALHATVRTADFQAAVSMGVSAVNAGRIARPVNALSEDDHDALRRKAGADALGAAIAAAGGWR